MGIRLASDFFCPATCAAADNGGKEGPADVTAEDDGSSSIMIASSSSEITCELEAREVPPFPLPSFCSSPVFFVFLDLLLRLLSFLGSVEFSVTFNTAMMNGRFSKQGRDGV